MTLQDKNTCYDGTVTKETTMTRLALIAIAFILVLSTALPAAQPKILSCYLMTNGRNTACICNRVSVPLAVCEKVNGKKR